MKNGRAPKLKVELSIYKSIGRGHGLTKINATPPFVFCRRSMYKYMVSSVFVVMVFLSCGSVLLWGVDCV